MRTVLVGGPRDGVPVELPEGRSYLRVPLHAHEGGGVAIYRLAPVMVAGVRVGELLLHEHERLSRDAAKAALARMYLAGAFR